MHKLDKEEMLLVLHSLSKLVQAVQLRSAPARCIDLHLVQLCSISVSYSKQRGPLGNKEPRTCPGLATMILSMHVH